MTVRRLSYYLFCVFVFSLPWQNPVSLGGSRTMSSLLGVGVFWLTLSVVLAEWRARRPSALFLSMLLFAAWQFATMAWTMDPESTLRRCVTLAQLLAMVWLVGELGESRRRRSGMMQAFVFGCFVCSAVLIQSWMASGAEAGRYSPEHFSLNETADTLAIGIVMALILLFQRPSRWMYAANIGYIPLAVISVVITGSRSGFIATCLALVGVPLVLRIAKPAYQVAWGVAIVGLFALAFFTLPATSLDENLERVTLQGSTEKVSTMTGRTIIWSAGYSVFTEHPVVGVGAGAFRAAVGPKLDRVRSPHNLFVSVAVETGIIGLAIVGVILMSAVIPVATARGEPRGLYLILFGVLLTTASVANVDTSKVLWLGLALLSLAGTDAEPAPRPAYDDRPRLADDAFGFDLPARTA